MYDENEQELQTTEQQEPKERYFGSVRFFKNCILLFVIVAIVLPSAFAISYKKKTKSLSVQVTELKTFPLNWLEEDGPSYQKLYPELVGTADASLATEEIPGAVYLTFEDGPSTNTDAILDALKEAGIKATFFVVDYESEEAAARMRRIVEEGHTIGLYTGEHNLNKMYETVEDFLADMMDYYEAIVEATGVAPEVFRFPAGSVNRYNLTLYREMLAEMIRRGFMPYDWSVNSGDNLGTAISAEEIADNVIQGVIRETTATTENGEAASGTDALGRAIVLLHDGASAGPTAEAIPTIVKTLTRKGYSFLPLTSTTKTILFDAE